MNIIITLFVTLFFSMTISQPEYASDELFVILTSEDAETQMMALVLATQSFNQEVPVRILLCSHAGDLALKGSDSPEFKPAGRSPKDLLNGLMSRGVTVEVCGIYLPNRPAEAADLTDGIGIAAPPEVAAYMKQSNVRYLTF